MRIRSAWPPFSKTSPASVNGGLEVSRSRSRSESPSRQAETRAISPPGARTTGTSTHVPAPRMGPLIPSLPLAPFGPSGPPIPPPPRRRAEDGSADHVGAVGALRLERTDDHAAPGACDIYQHVVVRQRPVLLERPSGHAFRGVRARAGHRRLDRRGGGGAGGEAYEHRLVRLLVEEIDGREVEVELGHRRVSQVTDHRLDDLFSARARTQHRRGHVSEGAEQPIAVLE